MKIKVNPPPPPKCATKSCQTDYRENDTQTNIYLGHEPLADPEFLRAQLWPPKQDEEKVFLTVEELDAEQRIRDYDAFCRSFMFRDRANEHIARRELIYPHRNQIAPYKQPVKHKTVDDCHVFEPLNSMTYQQVLELEPMLTFENILGKVGKIESSGARSRALRLLLGLPKPPHSRSSQDRTRPTSTSSSGRAHHAMLVKGRRRVHTPRCDSSFLPKMDRNNAVVLLQRLLRGRAAEVSMMATMEKCSGFFEELNRLPAPEKMYRARELSTIVEAPETEGEIPPSLKEVVGGELSDLFVEYKDVSFQRTAS